MDVSNSLASTLTVVREILDHMSSVYCHYDLGRARRYSQSNNQERERDENRDISRNLNDQPHGYYQRGSEKYNNGYSGKSRARIS